jgi:putative endonuclease
LERWHTLTGIEGSNPSPSAFATLKRGYGVTKSAVDTQKRENRMYYIYSLKCKDGYYVGCTDNLKERIERHKNANVPATAHRLPLKLDFYFAIENKYKAFKLEKYLKSGSGRAFINKHLL